MEPLMPEPEKQFNEFSDIDIYELERIQAYGKERGLKTVWLLHYNERPIEALEHLLQPHALPIETLRYRLYARTIDVEVMRLKVYPKTWFDLWVVFDGMVSQSRNRHFYFIERLIDNGYGDFELKTGC